jgi:hypothetical protein
MNRSQFFAAIICTVAFEGSPLPIHGQVASPAASVPAAAPVVSLKLPSTYVSTPPSADQLQLNADNSFSLQEAGETYHGTFSVSGNALELRISETNTNTTAIMQGSNLTDSNGQTWVLREQAPHPAPVADVVKNQAYSEMLARVQHGDMTVDFRAFRIAGASRAASLPRGLAGPSSVSARELRDHREFTRLFGLGDFEAAFASASRSLERNYASLVAHFDAMTACQALHRKDEVVLHQALADALADSIRISGDGKAPATAWEVVSRPEEYMFLSSIVGLRRLGPFPAGSSPDASVVPLLENGHAYEAVEVIGPDSTGTEYVWFNVDFDAGPAPAEMQLASQPMDVLDGRITIRAPAQARIERRGPTRVAVERQADEESRIVLDYGSERMTLVASETFSRCTGDFELSVRRMIAASSIGVEAFDLKSPLHGIAYWPEMSSSSDKAKSHRLMGLYIMRSDAAVEHLAFDLNADAARDSASWERLARNIAATLAVGQQSLPSQAGERRFFGFTATVPDGYVATREGSPVKLRKLTEFGVAASSLAVDTGYAPLTPPDGPQVKITKVTLLGMPAQWHETVQTEDSQRLISADAVVVLRRGPRPIYAHVALRSANSTEMEELKRIAASLRLAPPFAPAPGPGPARSPLTPPKASPVSQIRVRNSSGTDFRSVKVGGKDYGDIKAGATTAYQPWIGAYGFEPVSLLRSAGPMAIPGPIDHTGDPKLGAGHYTYVLLVRDGRLVSNVEQDKE